VDAEQDPMQPERCARTMAALAAPERLRIVRLLGGGARNVTEIAAALRLVPVNVSHHLNVLVAAGLIVRDRHGRYLYYSLAPGVAHTAGCGSRLRLALGCCWIELPFDTRTDSAREGAG
jgi:DNA-binding transcriptional ArsR family regulator